MTKYEFLKDIIISECFIRAIDHTSPEEVFRNSHVLYNAIMITGLVPRTFTLDDFRKSIIVGAKKSGNMEWSK